MYCTLCYLISLVHLRLFQLALACPTGSLWYSWYRWVMQTPLVGEALCLALCQCIGVCAGRAVKGRKSCLPFLFAIKERQPILAFAGGEFLRLFNINWKLSICNFKPNYQPATYPAAVITSHDFNHTFRKVASLIYWCSLTTRICIHQANKKPMQCFSDIPDYEPSKGEIRVQTIHAPRTTWIAIILSLDQITVLRSAGSRLQKS